MFLRRDKKSKAVERVGHLFAAEPHGDHCDRCILDPRKYTAQVSRRVGEKSRGRLCGCCKDNAVNHAYLGLRPKCETDLVGVFPTIVRERDRQISHSKDTTISQPGCKCIGEYSKPSAKRTQGRPRSFLCWSRKKRSPQNAAVLLFPLTNRGKGAAKA